MISMPVNDIVSKITKNTGLSESEVRSKIKSKIEQLYGLVSEEGAAHIIANEHGIKLFEVSGNLKIKDIMVGMKSVDITGKVMRKYEMREFNTEKRKGKVANLMLADETGTIKVVFWNEKTDSFAQIKDEDVVKIRGAYVRDNAGRKELHLGDNSGITINPPNVTINAREKKDYAKKHIKELTDGMSAEVMGTILQVFDVKFFESCPKCNKRMRMREDAFACDEHGSQSPVYNYVMNVYLDDGTSNIRTIFWKNQSQRLLKLNDEQFNEIRLNPMLFEKYKTDMLGTQIKVLGTAKNNITGRMEFNAEIVFTDLNPEQEIEMLDHMREVTLESKPAVSVSGNTASTTTTVQSSSPSIASMTKSEPKYSNSNVEKPVKSTDLDDEFEVSEDFLD
ncbi:MAG TPA: OB-fold nucleic acid binding domain-containing protein [Alphaproteobacteria bacterium]|nr:OB-fold nucleic acid binding domain-containing protein [Alphaproteobacteria bacterium]